METGTLERWENYRKANSDKPLVRESELSYMFRLVDPLPGEKIWEVGTGNGYLTFPLAEAVGEKGEVVTTDVMAGNISEVEKKNSERKLNIRPTLLPLEHSLLGEPFAGHFDAVATIATFHHFDNRDRQTGENGRRAAMEAFYHSLRSGGRLVMGDPVHGSITQEYFDAIDNPVHTSPDGHPHDFFTVERLKEVCEEVGFKNVSIEVKRVPWKFVSIEEVTNFIHTIHNAKCTPEESLEVAKKYLGLTQTESGFELGWELFFLKAVKS